MMPCCEKWRSNKGFSLIDAIFIICVASVACAMIAGYFGSFITKSSEPVHRLAHAAGLKQAAEQITAYYHENTGDLTRVQAAVSGNPSQFGTDFSVSYNGFVKFVSLNDVSIAEEDPEDLLKITITHDVTHENITLLFARR